MDWLVGVAILTVLLAWGALVLALRHWGPGPVSRRVQCPERGVPARIGVIQEEGDFGELRVTQVTDCSLFPRQALNCKMTCVRQL